VVDQLEQAFRIFTDVGRFRAVIPDLAQLFDAQERRCSKFQHFLLGHALLLTVKKSDIAMPISLETGVPISSDISRNSSRSAGFTETLVSQLTRVRILLFMLIHVTAR
jgi:hypothetical protein